MIDINPNIVIMPTLKFQVFCNITQSCTQSTMKDNNQQYVVNGAGSCERTSRKMLSNLENLGFCVRKNILRKESIKTLKNALRKLVSTLTANYSQYDDEFNDIDCEDFGIVRMPRIGKGKCS
jgi:hypothetical protein